MKLVQGTLLTGALATEMMGMRLGQVDMRGQVLESMDISGVELPKGDMSRHCQDPLVHSDVESIMWRHHGELHSAPTRFEGDYDMSVSEFAEQEKLDLEDMTLGELVSYLESDDGILCAKDTEPEDGPRLIQTGVFEMACMLNSEIHELLASGTPFMDRTNHLRQEPFYSSASVKYPTELTQGKAFKVLSPHISKSRLEKRLTEFSSFHTRFCKSELGLNSSLWLRDLIAHEGAKSPANFSVTTFDHDFPQKSLIARFEGTHTPEDIVIIGAHLDSINLKDYYEGRAPGADDNGSGSITILEVLHLLAESGWEPRNTVEFHWYAAEEIGLLGSQDVFAKYAAEGKHVKAMVQQDMTGGTKRDRGVPDDLGLVVDFVDPGLTDFLRKVIDEYADIPYAEFRCGYACSDHASANRYGYPSSFIIEYGTPEAIPDPGPRVGHNELDTVDRIDFDHMVQHVKLSLGAVLELGEAEF